MKTNEARTIEPPLNHMTASSGQSGLTDGLGDWIDAEKQKPELVKNENYSANVWGWDGKTILVVAWFVEPGEGWFWANAYGNIWGDAEFDDDYDIKFWKPILIPTLPNALVLAHCEL